MNVCNYRAAVSLFRLVPILIVYRMASVVGSVDAVDNIIRYHSETKHNFGRYSRSSGYMDWANQPDPFRRFRNAPLTSLHLDFSLSRPAEPTYADLFHHNAIAPVPISMESLSRFLELSLGLTSWKQAGRSKWSLRSNPSSGNLHPTEGYIVTQQLGDLAPGVYHYAPHEHGVELRASLNASQLQTLFASYPVGTFLVGFTSIYWRESWKYGERAFRYCNHDVGHAIGSARLAAASLGWNMRMLDELPQQSIAALLGTDREQDFHKYENEIADCLFLLYPRSSQDVLPLNQSDVEALVSSAQWFGGANQLSRKHEPWSIIDSASTATWKHESTDLPIYRSPLQVSRVSAPVSVPAERIIRQRRSAVSFDAATHISSQQFYTMLERTLPCIHEHHTVTPWDIWPYEATVHLLVFVHRVTGLAPGIYFLVRDPMSFEFIRSSTKSSLQWTPEVSAPSHIPLYRLFTGDVQDTAITVSCTQDIAGDSAFSLGMLAEFEPKLRERGAWWYRRMFWEAGLIGQVLYLEAEAAGVRGTGIGCFFDDPVHEILGVKDRNLQSLYHFTIGGPVEDRRIMSLPPYHHLAT